MKEIPIILLAAGQSCRMGGTDKLMQPVGGVPLLRRVAQRAIAVGPVFVALPPMPHPRYTVLKDLDVLPVEIPDAREGINASLKGAMAAIPADAKAVMILLSDLPDLTTADLRNVLQSVKTHPANRIWRGATNQGVPGHPVIFDRSLFAELIDLTGDSGAQSVVRRHKDAVHLHRLPSQNALLDLDTPEDWAEWVARQPSGLHPK
ncbi:nucleotidyltransferase family protein [Ruegeria conchae]|uniref:CTP:molybdopterin cytidylyltransferase MocA n=1 Tax=Ruegeria conchae TaxID=981384 RepID=A0A497ZQX3_9RHOB|nr:nucleotidyltransferase family protein [Ruegeria conchae]RLK10367.1 CTP:molybdopterin cytidylyltransferase MocA [Ruegeria conchae]